MTLMIVGLLFFVTGLRSEAWDNLNEHEDFIAGKAPFFELACMRVGGTCAKSNSCPPGTRVGQTGLCPEQQRFGMECCRPLKGVTECRSRHGECVPKSFNCSQNLKIPDASGCGLKETCCTRIERPG